MNELKLAESQISTLASWPGYLVSVVSGELVSCDFQAGFCGWNSFVKGGSWSRANASVDMALTNGIRPPKGALTNIIFIWRNMPDVASKSCAD